MISLGIRNCKDFLDDMHVCLTLQYEKEKKLLQSHIDQGHKGSVLEPRDYRREYDVLQGKQEYLNRTYDYLKAKCEEA